MKNYKKTYSGIFRDGGAGTYVQQDIDCKPPKRAPLPVGQQPFPRTSPNIAQPIEKPWNTIAYPTSKLFPPIIGFLGRGVIKIWIVFILLNFFFI